MAKPLNTLHHHWPAITPTHSPQQHLLELITIPSHDHKQFYLLGRETPYKCYEAGGGSQSGGRHAVKKKKLKKNPHAEYLNMQVLVFSEGLLSSCSGPQPVPALLAERLRPHSTMGLNSASVLGTPSLRNTPAQRGHV